MSKKYVWTFVLVLVIIAGGVYYFWNKQQANPPTIASFTGNLSCKEMYDEIENDIDNANYCKTDSDCDVLIKMERFMAGGQQEPEQYCLNRHN